MPAQITQSDGTVAEAKFLVASPSGGSIPYKYYAASSANQDSQVIKNLPGHVYTIALFNVNASIRYVKFYDKATGPTSSDTPVQTYMLPGNSSGTGMTLSFPAGMSFVNGIGFRMVIAQADSSAGAVTAGDVVLSITYK